MAAALGRGPRALVGIPAGLRVAPCWAASCLVSRTLTGRRLANMCSSSFWTVSSCSFSRVSLVRAAELAKSRLALELAAVSASASTSSLPAATVPVGAAASSTVVISTSPSVEAAVEVEVAAVADADAGADAASDSAWHPSLICCMVSSRWTMKEWSFSLRSREAADSALGAAEEALVAPAAPAAPAPLAPAAPLPLPLPLAPVPLAPPPRAPSSCFSSLRNSTLMYSSSWRYFLRRWCMVRDLRGGGGD
mmetsp:Transcript_7242/g.20122  ORF Transcript_7242/g.20122 Transcript_7242/m.20122 type:complete len:250 (+) Transcript_7242:3099-3848(+)